MEASELRIGNYIGIIHPNIETQCTPDHIKSISEGDTTYKPIPLTEEWLLKFGFNKEAGERWCDRHEEMEEVNRYYKGGFCLYYNPEQGRFIDDDLSLFEHKTEYVHQLQNLYFALTGKEFISAISAKSKQGQE